MNANDLIDAFLGEDTLSRGDKVKIIRTGETGIVQDTKGNDVYVLVRGFVWRYAKSSIKRI